MYVRTLDIQHFRSYKRRQIELGAQTVVIGKNGSGKTNLLEAVYLLATGTSFRARVIDEMVGWGSEVGRVTARIERDPSVARSQTGSLRPQDDNRDRKSLSRLPSEEVRTLEVVVTRGMVQGRRVVKRKFLVNGVPRQRKTFVGNLVVVLFRPEDLQLIGGNPSRRRKYLDAVLSQIDGNYFRSLLSYEKGLRRRNKLLEHIREGKAQRTSLHFWDQLLIKEGNVLTAGRRRLIDFINLQEGLGGGMEIEYDFSAISEQRLSRYKDKEVAAGHTLVGPHKDDFSISTTFARDSKQELGTDLAAFGSRGEQRMGVLWLKLAELAFIEQELGERPVLLLDDILSELDHEHREVVFGLLGKQQTLITTADEHFVEQLNGETMVLPMGEDA